MDTTDTTTIMATNALYLEPTRYRTANSSSPAGSVVDTIVETLPEQLKKGVDTGENNVTSNQDTPATQPTLEDTISVAPVELKVQDVTMEAPLPIATAAAAAAMEISEETRPEQKPTLSAADEGVIVEEKPEIDPIEQDILLQLEELKKEKSRLFALFR
ncbi:hypothetical protein BGZ89_005696, partial [Linnemannia elongata]